MPRTRGKTLHATLPIAETSFDPGVRVRRRLRGGHRQRHRGDARLRLPRAAGQARAAHARGDAGRGGGRQGLHVTVKKRNLLHAGPGLQAGKPRELHGGRSRISAEAHPRPRGQVAVALDARGQDRRRRRSARASGRPASSTMTRRSPGCEVVDRYTLQDSPQGSPTCAFSTCLPFPTPRDGARSRRGVWQRHRRASGRHGTVHAWQLQAQLVHRTAGQSGIPRSHLRARRAHSGDRRSRSPQRSRASGCRSCPAHRHQHHGGRPGALARVPQWRDRLSRPPAVRTREQALADGKLLPALAAKGILHQALLRPNVVFTYFNMEDPVVGGYTPEHIALRRAIGMAFNDDEAIRVLYSRPRACPPTDRSRPTSPASIPKLKTPAQVYDPAAARALLDKFGYKDRDGDGYRETPDGKPLVIERWSPPDSFDARDATNCGRRTWTRSASGVTSEIRQDAGTAQDGPQGQDPDARRRLECRLSGRRELHAAALRPERRAGQLCALQPAGIQQAVRRGAPPARFTGTHASVRPDDRAGASPTRRGGADSTTSRTRWHIRGCATTCRIRSASQAVDVSWTSTRRSARRAG